MLTRLSQQLAKHSKIQHGRKLLQPTGAFLYKLAELIDRDCELLAGIDSFDNGKTYASAMAVDFGESYNVFRYYAGATDKISGTTIETSPAKLAYVLQEPLGVCGRAGVTSIQTKTLIRCFATAIAPRVHRT